MHRWSKAIYILSESKAEVYFVRCWWANSSALQVGAAVVLRRSSKQNGTS